MSDDDLTAAAEHIRTAANWSRWPKLAAIFQHRPSVNRYWHELVALTLFSLEEDRGLLSARIGRREDALADAAERAGRNGGWIGVDLDGTLAYHERGQRLGVIGAPIPEMVERVKRWRAEGRDVRIFTARAAAAAAGDMLLVDQLLAIEAWCEEHLGERLPITAVKDGDMDELWDDRAVTVERNTGRPLAPSSRGLK